MILKGKSRAGALDLALHISNCVENDRVHVAQIKGMVANDLYAGFREWELIATQTNAKKPFYSLSINPDPNQKALDDEEWFTAADHIEKELGLGGQPRVIVFHEKRGEDGTLRKHAHVVWSRIKTDNRQLRTVSDSFDYYTLKRCATELTKRFRLELPFDNEHKTNTKTSSYDHAQSHGINRDLETSEARKKTVTELWNDIEEPQAFRAQLENTGYILAIGDRRAFVIVDRDAQVYALARQIEGVKTRIVRARLAFLDNLPNVETAKAMQRNAARITKKKTAQRQDLTRRQRQMTKLRNMAIRADQLRLRRRDTLQNMQKALSAQHTQEKADIYKQHGAREAHRLKRRYANAPKGRLKSICNAIGVSQILNWLDAREDQNYAAHYKRQIEHVKCRQQAERDRLQTRHKRLEQQEQREARSIRKLQRLLHLTPLQYAEMQAQQKQRLNDQRISQKTRYPRMP